MGKVIKGSQASLERYTVGIPTPAPAGAGGSDDAPADGFAALDAFETFDGERRIGAAAQPEPPPEPDIDLEAIAAQAQELIDAAGRQADALVADAGERAGTIVAAAEAQAQTIRTQARLAAHDEGYAAGMTAAQAEMAAALTAMHDLLDATRAERHVLITAAEPELVRLALGIAERVLHQQVALDGGVVVEMAKAAILRLVDREKITVRVNPADIEPMRAHREALLGLGDVKTMRIIEDQRVDRGGVVIETDGGSVDAKISTQLTEVRKILHIVDDVVVMQPAPLHADAADDEPLAPARAS